ncbi:presenilins-associated rhomboid-like protein, mitochondrial [Tribolium castaneum]|uniref:rhomboid protease n=1 Tax=Tribolium castaneum TaxID=7070 RepID=D6WL40_TRICA|nr:PREDICTED: presenilins-associated rhomboid-like protein, mitochondrial [Tribolium castaneum]EFA03514.2 Presenilins-associated rhomboid-like protein, mitochondrial [Tribolium castaneum]|eukprot:XP_008193694.1 PREDICTED: presenilins-associated rhomboid-like protein, mitochondrial [Tribolium castaneum]
MALSRMLRLGELCTSRSTLLMKNSPPKSVRNFRRRNNEPPKPNVSSIETPFQDVSLGGSSLHPRNLWKPFGFTIGFSAACFVGAAIWEYENMRAHAIKMLKKPVRLFKRQADEFHSRSHTLLRQIEEKWKLLTPGEKVFVPICLINVLVFGAWRIPRLQPFMLKYFCSNPGSKSVCWPMILSTFSHYSGFHLLANMYVLHSFSTGAVHSLGKEQFLGLYLGAGVISSFTSYVYKVITKQPGLSLGASGAIMAILGYVCTQYPETKLGIILLPIFTFSAGAAIKVIVGIDTAGVLMGWKFFDHAAHLGGAACGIMWALWGNQYLWAKREPILHYWHEFRGSIK